MRLLVVEDEEKLNSVLCKRFRKQGYSVDSCLNGEDASDYVFCGEYDAVILDVMLPGKTGFEVLEEMREAGNDTPVIMLTARDTVDDKVNGLDLGADDYLTKPFSFDELMARIRVITRKHSGSSTNIYECEGLKIDTSAKSVYRDDEKVDLSLKEYNILEVLMMNKGKVLSRDEILSHISDYGYEGGSNVVDVYIRFLRKKIDEGHDRKYIETVRGQGYVVR